MNVLVTGGAGYIGSHAALRLLEDGHAVTIVDDLSRGHVRAIEAMRGAGDLHFEAADVVDAPAIGALLAARRIEAVMHFAALAYVGESVEQPLRYWRTNVGGTAALLEAADTSAVTRFVFSSSCATYGAPPPQRIPIDETCPQEPVNPYGHTKLAAERMLAHHLAARRAAGRPFAAAALRYFNVAGCRADGRLGEDHDPETHLIPVCLKAALRRRPAVTIHGTDYDTPDGTCIRDYVHVDDLVDAHVRVLRALRPGEWRAYNLGIGRGHSVREVVESCRRVTGVPFDAEEGPRRPGDPPVLYADPSKIRRELGWSARMADLDAIVASAWRWAASLHRERGVASADMGE